MSDTVDDIDTGTLRVPNSTGENVTEAYAVYYPYDGLLVPVGSREDALENSYGERNFETVDMRGSIAVKITIERIDP